MMERERSVVPNSHFRLHSVHSDHWESLGCWLSISQNSFNWMVQLHPSTMPCHSPHPKHPKEKIDVDVLPSNLFAIKKKQTKLPLSVELLTFRPQQLNGATKNGRNLRSSNSESTTSIQCCWPQGRISCPTKNKGFFPCQIWGQLGYQDLGR